MQAKGVDQCERDLASVARVAAMWRNNWEEAAGSTPIAAHSPAYIARPNVKREKTGTVETPEPESQTRTTDCFFLYHVQ